MKSIPKDDYGNHLSLFFLSFFESFFGFRTHFACQNIDFWTQGMFYSGDSYIVLNTYKKKGGDALQWDVHFWLGKYTTQDEAGTAAYKTVELDGECFVFRMHCFVVENFLEKIRC